MLTVATIVTTLAVSRGASAQEITPITATSARSEQGIVHFDVGQGLYVVRVTREEREPFPAPEGAQTCAAPCTLRLAPGHWSVGVRWADGTTQTRGIDVEAGGRLALAYDESGTARVRAFRSASHAMYVATWVSLGVGLASFLTIPLVAVGGCFSGTPAGCTALRATMMGTVVSLGLVPGFLLASYLFDSFATQPRARASIRVRPALAVDPAGASAGLAVTF